MKLKTYQYCSWRNHDGYAAWRDDQTGRWVKAATVAKRTGLPLLHIRRFEEHIAAQQAEIEERVAAQAVEAAAGVCLY